MAMIQHYVKPLGDDFKPPQEGTRILTSSTCIREAGYVKGVVEEVLHNKSFIIRLDEPILVDRIQIYGRPIPYSPLMMIIIEE